MRKNKFKSPDINPRYMNINSHRINNYFLPNNDSDLYDDIIETKINNTNNFNNIGQMDLYKYKDIDEDYNPNITKYFMNLNNNVKQIKKENIFLQNKIKKYKNQIISKDNEIDNYKQKVRCLLNQVQDKNYDIRIKQNTIIKLSEEKDIFQNNQTSTNNMINKNELYNLKVQLQLQKKEKEKYISHIKYLNSYIQKLNKNNIQQAQISTKKYNNKNQESEKSSEYNESGNNQINKKNINNNQKLVYSNRELKKSSFILQITGEALSEQNNDNEIINNYSAAFEEYKKSKEIELNNLMKEIEEKNILLLKKEKAINDYVLNLKALKEENLNLKNNLNKRIVELNEYKLKYDDDNKNKYSEDKKIEMELIIRENKELKDKLNLIEEEKINNQNKIDELNEDIENLKENIDNYKKQLNEKNELLIKSNEEIIALKEKEKNFEKINNENLNMKQNIEKINTELKNFQSQNEQLINEKNDLNKKILLLEDNYNNSIKEINDIKQLNFELNEKIKNIQLKESKEENALKLLNTNNNLNNNNININNELDINAKEIQKENDVLQKRVIQLNNLIEDLNTQINELNIKYSKLKKENINLTEASQALLEKQKQQMENKDKIDNISPDTHYIITKKTYNKLIWYLISIINPNDKNMAKNSTYDNYKWVTELSIPKTQLNKFNKFEDDDAKINDLYSYIKTMQDKLEKKEDELNKKNYENIKLNDKLQNKTSNIKVGKLFLTKMLNNDKINNNNNINNKSASNQNNTLKNNATSYMGGNNNGDMEKYKNLLDQLNDYDEREKKFQSEISKLKSQLIEQEKLVSGVKDINNIPFNMDSKYDDIEDKKIIDALNSESKSKKKEENKDKDNENFLGILNDVPGEESDLDEIKGLKNLVAYLKKLIKDKDSLLNELLVQIKEMIKNLNWSIKNNQIVTKILTILGYTPEIIKIVTENKKGFNFDFKLEVKK